MKPSLTGIILSGGKSSRMGSEKGLVHFNEKPLIEYSVSLLNTLCDEIIICSNNSSYDYLGFTTVSDVFPECGPMGGIYSGLCKSSNHYNIFVPCDVPFLTADVYEKLLLHINGNIAIVPAVDNIIQPLCGIYSTECIPLFKELLMKKKYKMLLGVQEIGAKIIPLNIDKRVFANVNTLDDLHALNTL